MQHIPRQPFNLGHSTPPAIILLNRDVIVRPTGSIYPVPDTFLSTGSQLVSIIVPLFKSNGVIKAQIDSWDVDSIVPHEIIYVDDSCPNNSKQVVLDAWQQRGFTKPVGKIVVNSHNGGYGAACNIGAEYATGKYLVFLNADTIVTPGWLDTLLKPFDDDSVGIIGNLHLKLGGPLHGTIDSLGSQWNWASNNFEHIGRNILDGNRLHQPLRIDELPAHHSVVCEREMVTGCCFAIRTSLFKALDGFDPHYHIGYWEDSDLCLRARERGYKILFQPNSVIWHSLSHSGSTRHKYMRYNGVFFSNRWTTSGRIDPLINTPRHSASTDLHRILVRRLGAGGDVLLATGILPALKKRWPHSQITFQTTQHQILRNNPYVTHIATQAVPDRVFQNMQLVINLDMAYEYHPTWPIIAAYADHAHVSLDDYEPYIYVEKDISSTLNSKYIVMHVQQSHCKDWVGRSWEVPRFTEIADRLRGIGYTVVCVGDYKDAYIQDTIDLRNRLDVASLAGVLSTAALFIGVDSLPMHIAQVVGTPGIAFFGSILPELRLINDKITPVRVNNLPCLGCHHRQPPPAFTIKTCAIGDTLCEKDLTVESVWETITRKLEI